MVDKAELLALAERVEGLSGPSPKLDVEIWLTSVGRDVPMSHFTASLDAAMGLVPEGWWLFHIYVSPEEMPGDRFKASVYNDQSIYAASGRASTPALALTAAALRARAEGGE